MRIDGPTFVPKSGYFLLIRVKVCFKKLGFSYFLCQFLLDGFFDKMFKQEIHLCPNF